MNQNPRFQIGLIIDEKYFYDILQGTVPVPDNQIIKSEIVVISNPQIGDVVLFFQNVKNYFGSLTTSILFIDTLTVQHFPIWISFI